MIKEERVIIAAIYFRDGKQYDNPHQPINIDSGYVLCGLRHGFIFADNAIIFGKDKNERLEHPIQGFMTNHRRFVDRKEAFQIATKMNQIVEMIGEQTELYSENLY